MNAGAERLDGWKEMASYLKRSVRCVQRWEKNEELPVRRHRHQGGVSVYAFRHDLDSWWQGDQSDSTPSPREPAGFGETEARGMRTYAQAGRFRHQDDSGNAALARTFEWFF